MRSFLVCIHDATPAFARETRLMLGDLAPLVGRRLAVGVVPDWHGAWPLAAHPDFCRLLRDAAEERLLHGFFHQRRRGWGAATLLADGCDEMNGLDPAETRRVLARGQRALADAFGEPARGFLAPGWQRGHVRPPDGLAPADALGLEHVLGFFALDAGTARRVPLATWTWDVSRWGWTSHLGHALGRLLQATGRGVPTLAVHPRDVTRGFWPAILRLTRELLGAGYAPVTPSTLLRARHAEVAV